MGFVFLNPSQFQAIFVEPIAISTLPEFWSGHNSDQGATLEKNVEVK